MANLQTILKTEIQRLARKEIRTQTAALHATVTSQRKRITKLADDLAATQKEVARLKRQLRHDGDAATTEQDADAPAVRFSAPGFAGHRKRLGLSASQVAAILGVSALSVYKWESGKTRPRAKQLAEIAKFRKLGKREANAILELASQA